MGIDVYSTKIYGATFGNGPISNLQNLSASASATSAVGFVGPVRYRVSGDFGGGTAVLQTAVSAAATFVPVAGTTATAAVDKISDFPPGALNTCKVALTGGAAASCDVLLQGSSQ